MEKSRDDSFEENRPDVTEQEILEAAQRKSVVLSFGALPLAVAGREVEFLGVKLVLADGTVKTVLFDRYSCSLLCGLAGKLDEGKWLIRQSRPPGQRPQ